MKHNFQSIQYQVGFRIRTLRKKLKWSQMELALQCGLHRAYIGHIERGEKNLGLTNIEIIANTLHIEPYELLLPETKFYPDRRYIMRSKRLNKYICEKCKQSIITIDKDEGTTPFIIPCFATKNCMGFMRSDFYQTTEGIPTFEWRKPTPEEYTAADPAMTQHFDMGGLDIYPIKNHETTNAKS